MHIEQNVIIGDCTVRRIAFGAMRLSTEDGDRHRSILVARRALELVDLIDTAFMYGWGANEELLAEALSPYPTRLLIATKVGIVQPRPGEWAVCGRPDVLRKQTENALRRLKIESIGLLQLHRLDPEVPIADQVGVLAELQREGKVRNVGLSEISCDDLTEALAVLPITSVQNRYSVYNRDAEAVLKMCEARRIAFLPWQPISASKRNPAVPLVNRIARERGATNAQVALAWLLHHSPVIAPIPGTGSIDHLEENVLAATIALSDQELDLLSAIS